MFLFEGKFGNILHTGDCRLSPECLQNLPEKYIGKKGKEPHCRLDCVFLDCTFGSFSQRMPSKHFAVQEVLFDAIVSRLCGNDKYEGVPILHILF